MCATGQWMRFDQRFRRGCRCELAQAFSISNLRALNCACVSLLRMLARLALGVTVAASWVAPLSRICNTLKCVSDSLPVRIVHFHAAKLVFVLREGETAGPLGFPRHFARHRKVGFSMRRLSKRSPWRFHRP